MTYTDIVTQRIIDKGVELDPAPISYSKGRYRIQPKVTGIEARRALSFWNPFYRRWADVGWKLNGEDGSGIDLMNPVKELATCDMDLFRIARKDCDWFLWCYVYQETIYKQCPKCGLDFDERDGIELENGVITCNVCG